MDENNNSKLTGKDVTVVIPMYNSEATISNALSSVYSQTARPASIILIDDGSTDGSVKIAEQWAKNNQNINVEIITIKNNGAANARNIGINKVNTTLTAFLDADDTWQPDKIQKQLEILNDASYSPCNLVCTGSILRPITNKIIRITKRKLLIANLVSTSSVLAKTDILRKFLLDTRLKRAEDYNLWLKIASTDVGIITIDSILLNYTIESSQNKLSNNQKEFHMDELKNFKLLYKEKYLSFFEYLFAILFSTIKYIRRGIIKHANS